MAQERSFEELMASLRAGDNDAAALVFNRFAQRLIALARTRLDGQLRQKVDPEDVKQSVFRSFFARYAGGQFDIKNWDSLWGLLVVMTVRKCGRQVSHFHAQAFDVRKEVRPSAGADESGTEWQAPGQEPTPVEVVVLTETVETLMRGLDPRDRRIVELRLQGYTVLEVSQQVDLTERTIHRVLNRVKDRLEKLRANGSEAG